MQVTIGARCWDGERRRTLPQPVIKVEGIPVAAVETPERGRGWLKHINHPCIKIAVGFAVPLLLLAHGLPPIGLTHAFAQTVAASAAPSGDAVAVMAAAAAPASAGEKIMHAFDPLIHLVQSLSYPIAGVMIAGGCLFIMVGQREQGMKMLQNAAIGYILVQLSPMLLSLLVGIGAGV